MPCIFDITDQKKENLSIISYSSACMRILDWPLLTHKRSITVKYNDCWRLDCYKNTVIHFSWDTSLKVRLG